MPAKPLQIFSKLDPQLLKLVDSTHEIALADGVLPRKVKLLIALALDAVQGTTPGVRSLTQAAILAGAKREEITEALRVAFYIGGVGSVYTAAPAFEELL